MFHLELRALISMNVWAFDRATDAATGEEAVLDFSGCAVIILHDRCFWGRLRTSAQALAIPTVNNVQDGCARRV